MAEGGKLYSNCKNASNPYHNCGEYCTSRMSKFYVGKGKKSSDSFIQDAPRSVDRRKRESKSQQKSFPVLQPANYASPQLHTTMGEMVNVGQSSSEHISDMIDQESSYRKGQASKPKAESLKSITHQSNGTPTAHAEDEELHYFSQAFLALLKSDEDEESQSVISDSDFRVRVGKYFVKESISSILQEIFDKHGDIAATCQLESLSVCTTYLECICFVVQELQSTILTHLTQSKVKELLTILKDIESSGINVSWLQSAFNKITEPFELVEPIELVSQLRATEAARFNCAQALESTKKELESIIEDLAVKEKQVVDDKARVAAIKESLRELELESSKLNANALFIRSKLEYFHCRASSGELP